MRFPAKGDGGGSGGGGKDFIKLKDGDMIEGCFIGDPIDYRDHFKEGVCEGEMCPLCQQGKKSSFKFRINFVTKENDMLVAKIWQQGWTAYSTLAGLSDVYEKDGIDISKQKFRITRKGSGKEDTEYQIIPIPNGIVADPVFALIKKVPLQDLYIGLKKDKEEEFPPTPQDDDDIGF